MYITYIYLYIVYMYIYRDQKQNIGSGSSKDGATNGSRGVKNAMHEIETASKYFPCVIWSRPEAGPPHFFVMAFVLLLA